jgi:hypothetical protein
MFTKPKRPFSRKSPKPGRLKAPKKRPAFAKKRPAFDSNSKKGAIEGFNIFVAAKINVKSISVNKPALTEINGAMPHRMSWKDIRNNVERFLGGADKKGDFLRWTERFLDAGRDRIGRIEEQRLIRRLMRPSSNLAEVTDLLKRAKVSQKKFESARDDLATNPKNGSFIDAFLKEANQFHANVPDIGPHLGVNNPVQEHGHLNFEESRSRGRSRTPRTGIRERSLTPMSRRVAEMSPGRVSSIAMDKNGKFITPRGHTVAKSQLSSNAKAILFPGNHGTKMIEGYDPNAKFGLRRK